MTTSRKIAENWSTKENEDDSRHICVNHWLLVRIHCEEAVSAPAAPVTRSGNSKATPCLKDLHLVDPLIELVSEHDIHWKSIDDLKFSMFMLLANILEGSSSISTSLLPSKSFTDPPDCLKMDHIQTLAVSESRKSRFCLFLYTVWGDTLERPEWMVSTKLPHPP